MSQRDIIVIGGSSGATAPLRQIVASLPETLPAAVFVVLHIPARSIGILSTVVSAAGKLPVIEASHDIPIEPGRIYLAAPDNHMILRDGRVVLGRGPRENMVRPAIDPLFRSAAISYGPRVIGVILSGLLNDGAAGLHAIKRCGGMAVVQDPGDATADEMPRSAMAATTVDLCVPGAKLGDVLAEIAGEPAGAASPIPPEIQIEVDIAAGGRVDSDVLHRIAEPAALTCPGCGGVLSTLKEEGPLRFRCQVGHTFTAEILAKEQEGAVDEALRVALRVIEERAELVTRMAADARRTARRSVAEMYEERAQEYRRYAETIRRAVLQSLQVPAKPPD